MLLRMDDRRLDFQRPSRSSCTPPSAPDSLRRLRMERDSGSAQHRTEHNRTERAFYLRSHQQRAIPQVAAAAAAAAMQSSLVVKTSRSFWLLPTEISSPAHVAAVKVFHRTAAGAIAPVRSRKPQSLTRLLRCTDFGLQGHRALIDGL